MVIINNTTQNPLTRSKDFRKALIETKLRIRNKRGDVVPFIMNVAQAYYWDRMTRRNLVLKARQKGLSKVIDGDQYVTCAMRTTNAVVISHEKESTERLFAAVKAYHDNMKIKPEVSIDSKRMMKFPKRGSTFFVGTAGQVAFGRGDTIDRAHLSEAAFYPNLEKTLAGVAEAAEYGQIDIETTPNGRDYFYDLWDKAKKGLSPYTCIFIPWFIDKEYSSDHMTEEEKAGLSKSVQEMFAIPDEEFAQMLTEEETELLMRVANDYNIILTPGQIKWRRYKIWDKGDLFFQEYPEDDESCFLQAGRSVFKKITVMPQLKIPLDHIEKMKVEDRERLLGNREKKIRKKTLYGGIDPAEGTLTGDAHCFSVIEPMSPHADKKAVVIFEMTSNEPIDVFMLKAEKICSTFDIILGIEGQGIGGAMVKEATDLEVSFNEWETTGTSRPIMITDLEQAYRKEELIETYTEAEGEARNMIYNKKNRAEHPNGKHDDRVFSRAIALQMFNMPKPSVTIL